VRGHLVCIGSHMEYLVFARKYALAKPERTIYDRVTRHQTSYIIPQALLTMPTGRTLQPLLQMLMTGAAVAVFSVAVWRAPWKSWLIGHSDRQHLWLGSLAGLLVLCSVRSPVVPGMSLQFLLVTTLTLMHGWMLAVVGLGVIFGIDCLQHGDWMDWPADLVCDAVIPALFIHYLHYNVARRLPRNYFVYIFVTVFAGSIAAFTLAELATLGLLAASGSTPAVPVATDFVVALGLMAFAEASLNGMVMSAAVVFRPDCVASFEDSAYFAR